MARKEKLLLTLVCGISIVVASFVFGIPVGYEYDPITVCADQNDPSETEYFSTALDGYYLWEFDATADEYGVAGGSACYTIYNLTVPDSWGPGCVFTSDEPYDRDGHKTLDKDHSFKETIVVSTGGANWFTLACGTQWTIRKKDSK